MLMRYYYGHGVGHIYAHELSLADHNTSDISQPTDPQSVVSSVRTGASPDFPSIPTSSSHSVPVHTPSRMDGPVAIQVSTMTGQNASDSECTTDDEENLSCSDSDGSRADSDSEPEDKDEGLECSADDEEELENDEMYII